LSEFRYKMPELSGQSIIGFSRSTSHASPFHSVDPSNGTQLLPPYYSASSDELDRAAQLAGKAFQIYRRATGRDKASFLRKIAENIESLGNELVTRATAETALPAARIKNEIARTCNQLRLFAEMVEEGSWVDARIDRADPSRNPLPKPDVRSMLQPLGPVVVFCASNFPLAFSVAGGDTASALAAGNPVIVKAHHAHPGTAELVGLALSDAVRSCDLPEGVFSLIYGPGSEVGARLVQHPSIKAGGFTGSRAGGLALLKLASTRPEPIPFYAEMSSVNPVFILPTALAERTEEIAKGLHGSVTLGAGQFCTNPGLVFVPEEGSDKLIKRLGELMAATSPFTMLTEGIASAYRLGAEGLQNSRVKSLAQPDVKDGCTAGAALFLTDAESFLEDPSLSAEVFGPSTLLIKYSNYDDLLNIARSLEGQLTATIHGAEDELRGCEDLISILETKAGRLVFNGFPTGVEVGHAMVHGGPFPATPDGRSTSVGTRAALRFVRPVCYQDFADSALPAELKDANPLKIWRMVDGEMTKN
jgi:alpha-ketoglutaric semialdehyde dehydrogenase